MNDHRNVTHIPAEGSLRSASHAKQTSEAAQAARQRTDWAGYFSNEVWADAFSTLRIRSVTPQALAALRAEVRKRLALHWARAA